MAELNRNAAAVMASFDVSACTDITGFGLLGHLAEMVSGSGAGVRIVGARVPVVPEGPGNSLPWGLIPAGAYNNRTFRESMTIMADGVPRSLQDVLFDPQTSGGGF